MRLPGPLLYGVSSKRPSIHGNVLFPCTWVLYQRVSSPRDPRFIPIPNPRTNEWSTGRNSLSVSLYVSVRPSSYLPPVQHLPALAAVVARVGARGSPARAALGALLAHPRRVGGRGAHRHHHEARRAPVAARQPLHAPTPAGRARAARAAPPTARPSGAGGRAAAGARCPCAAAGEVEVGGGGVVFEVGGGGAGSSGGGWGRRRGGTQCCCGGGGSRVLGQRRGRGE